MRIKLLCCLLLATWQGTYAQTALHVAADTLKIVEAELVIRNATRNTQGYLFNAGNGVTGFRKIGTAVQFSVGAPGFPQAGDSVYLNPGLSGRYIKVWRNGLLQKTDPVNGIGIDTTVGKVIFRPVLINADRIYIEAFTGNDFSSVIFYTWPVFGCYRHKPFLFL